MAHRIGDDNIIRGEDPGAHAIVLNGRGEISASSTEHILTASQLCHPPPWPPPCDGDDVCADYKRGGYFGELALITDEPRKATVRASSKGATLLRLDRSEFEDTLKLKHRDINLLNFADRSPITTVPHAKVSRAFEIFRKLGMRHMCVVDDDCHVVGMLTRKDLMTYRIKEHIVSGRLRVVADAVPQPHNRIARIEESAMVYYGDQQHHDLRPAP